MEVQKLPAVIQRMMIIESTGEVLTQSRPTIEVQMYLNSVIKLC